MKVYCTICSEEWEASKYVIESSYVCPHCDWKIERGINIRLGRKKSEKHIRRLESSSICTT